MKAMSMLAVASLALVCSSCSVKDQKATSSEKYVFHGNGGNPYLPLWEHLPDGEPRVFEDPDNPGKYRAYIIGSHDMRFNSYCGPDIRMWSAPVEDLSTWRDEGAIFTYNIDDQWDVMYAPDLVEVNRPNGTREYYLYPHSRGPRREALVCKGPRPNGPFTPVNASEDGESALPGSVLGFDPSVFIEPITDQNDPDYSIGFRAYGFWGFQHSSAAQLDQEKMYSVRPGTELIGTMLPSRFRNGGPFAMPAEKVAEYPCLFEGEDPASFNFFEASSIRQVENKYVVIYSGFSGVEYGLGMSNSTLRYAYGDTPLGPWKNGGVLVDSRAPVADVDGSKIITSNAGHNTHGSIEKINGQWYVFYHRPPRGFGYARQPMVAPIKIVCDEKPVSEGGKVVITGFNPYAESNVWTAKAADGNEYTGAEVTSEGFYLFGLDPYKYYSAGYACYLSDVRLQQDSWDIWDNHMEVGAFKSGDVVGYKYFGFGGLDKDTLGIKAFEGTKESNNTLLNVFLTPKTDKNFSVKVWLDSPSDKNGQLLGTVEVAAGSAQEPTKYEIGASAVDVMDKKHAIYFEAVGESDVELFSLQGLGFSANGGRAIERPVPPTIQISVNGKELEMPQFPVRSTNENGLIDYAHYEVDCNEPAEGAIISAVATNGKVDISINGNVVKFTYKGIDKIYTINFK